MQHGENSTYTVIEPAACGIEEGPSLHLRSLSGVRKAQRPDYRAGASAGLVLQRALEDGAAMIAANAHFVAQSDSPAGPHQLRVGLRRARSTLWAGRRLLEPDALRALGDRARELGRVVGEVRMLDVFRFEMLPRFEHAVREELGDADIMTKLARRVARTAETARKELSTPEALLKAATLSCDLLTAARFATSTAAPKAARKLGRGWARKVLKAAARRVFAHPSAFEAMSIERRHELRKDVKRLRYALEGFRPLFAAEAFEPTHRAVRRLSNALGSLNDSADVTLLRTIAPDTRFEPAVEATIAAAEALAAADAPRAAERWRVLQDADRFWR